MSGMKTTLIRATRAHKNFYAKCCSIISQGLNLIRWRHCDRPADASDLARVIFSSSSQCKCQVLHSRLLVSAQSFGHFLMR